MCTRRAVAGDADCLGVLATQVFLDTYATEGIRPDLAREVLSGYSPDAFARALADPRRELHVAELEGALVAYVEVAIDASCPVEVARPSSEVARLYVQQPFLRQGLGSRLLRLAEDVVAVHGGRTAWLAAWVGNDRALAFYRAMGYADVGRTDHVIEGTAYENRVFAKALPPTP